MGSRGGSRGAILLPKAGTAPTGSSGMPLPKPAVRVPVQMPASPHPLRALRLLRARAP
jgi:hypothetical protein